MKYIEACKIVAHICSSCCLGNVWSCMYASELSYLLWCIEEGKKKGDDSKEEVGEVEGWEE